MFCVLEPRSIYRDTGPIAAVVVNCADPRAMARFWSETMDWTLHEVTDDLARLRSAKATCHGYASPIQRATSSVSSPRADAATSAVVET